jgi:hypothetical protein
MPTWYRDADNDNFGKAVTTTKACTKPTGYVANSTDCCDTDATTYPASNTCSANPNGCSSFDYDCDGTPRECNAPVSTCPADGICSNVGVCTTSSCKSYSYNFQGFGCGLAYTYLVTTQTCSNNGGCDTSIGQATGNNIACD